MLQELQRFILTAQEGSLTRTAEKIFITQSALTQSMQRLEKELGTKLFMQKGKYLQLTEDGQAVVIIGEKMLQLWENAKNPMLRKNLLPNYSIGMFDNAALRLGSYFQTHMSTNKFRIDLTIDNSGKLFSQLRAGVIDMAICVLNTKYVLPRNILPVYTFSEELLAVSSKKYPGPLKDIPFILYNKGSHTREQTDEIFAKNNIQPKIFAESTSTSFMKELAMLGSGVALLPKNFISTELSQGILFKHRFPLRWERVYGVFLNREGSLDKNHPIVKDVVKNLQKTK
jgi:DNA-binding transcriptional LysR family regulator